MELYIEELKKDLLINTKEIKKIHLEAGLNVIAKNIKDRLKSSGITLTNNEIKYIIKAIRSLENRGILLKGTSRKITSQEGGFLNFVKPLMLNGLAIKKDRLTPLAKSVLVSLRLAVPASVRDAAIQKNIFGSSMTVLIISNKKIKDVMKIAKSPEESGLLIKTVSDAIKNEAREQKGGFLGMLLGTLSTSI